MGATYEDFICGKSQSGRMEGFEPIWIPDKAMDFQRYLIEWATRLGRAEIMSDCGTGKTLMQLTIADNWVRKTNRPVMLATPIAVGKQTIDEAEKFGINAKRTRDGKMTDEACIWVTNYEQLYKYDPMKFAGFVGDEASCCKDFKSDRKATVAEFTRQMKYRLLATATAAPNDFHELGTSSEILGYLGFRDMITTFFKQVTSKDHKGWGRVKYRFRGHAEEPFWSWVCSWARSMRKPSDLGFDDSKFILPPLIEHNYVIETAKPRCGQLFTVAAKDMREERAERRHSIKERCEKAVEIAQADGPAVLWCDLNDEADLVEKMLDDVVQVSGSMSDDAKEEVMTAFSAGQIRRMVIKPKIGAWGLNWQHCRNVISFPTHSYEQDYQLVRRCWRFGQTQPVTVSRIVCEGERAILDNQKRKSLQTEKMFSSIVKHMADSMSLVSNDFYPEQEKRPSWLA